MDSDEEDFVFVGTPIEREEELTSRRKKAIAEASGNLRTLPSWKQEVRDEEGRRRFHGAFTGGFSAGYYNTVGSKEGWAPQSFTSSRKNRAEVKQQSILNFLDVDEKSELEGQFLGTSSQFDTFGFTAAEYARKQVEKEQQQRPSAIPGPAPDEIVVPVTESIGIKLLLKMGWRHGRSIKDLRASSQHDARREARKAFLAFSSDGTKDQLNDTEPTGIDEGGSLEQTVNHNVQSAPKTPVFVLNPKQDLHGLGFDPFKQAPEFREKKILRMSRSKEPGYRKGLSIKESLFPKSGKVAPGFGIGALEEYDVEDDDVYASGYNFEETYIQEDDEPSRFSIDSKPNSVVKEQGVLPGFRVASNTDYQTERFEPPVIPKDFVPHHRFPPESDNTPSAAPPPEVTPPDDNNLKLLIEGVATLVARCGKIYEDLSREKNQSNPLFNFLSGGTGHEYYAWKLWEEQQKRGEQTKLILDSKLSKNVEKMDADSRGKLLGEKPLERTSRELKSSITPSDIRLPFNLSDTFTSPASNDPAETAKPFKDDPAKQERFEQFLKDKYHGGIRSTDSAGVSLMSETVRARERLDFEAVAEAIEKGKSRNESKPTGREFLDLLAVGGMQFTSGGVEQSKDTQAKEPIASKMYPKREEFQWRPYPVLCKRFDLGDPFMGKPPPTPRARRKMDTLIFTSDAVKIKDAEETVWKNADTKLVTLETKESEADKEIAAVVEAENVERPIDLYKAIFSDDSDDEAEASDLSKVDDPKKKIEVANTTLNRLMAGDFLESLGKELGLELPPELPNPVNKSLSFGPQNETTDTIGGSSRIPPNEKNSLLTPVPGPARSQELLHDQEAAQLHTNSLEGKSAEVSLEKVNQNDKKAKSLSSRPRPESSSSSSEDDRSQKRSRRHSHRSYDSYSYSSSDNDGYHSRSKGRKKESSSRKRSKHHNHRSRESHSGSRHDKREKRRGRD